MGTSSFAIEAIVAGAEVRLVSKFEDQFSFEKLDGFLLLASQSFVHSVLERSDDFSRVTLREEVFWEEVLKIPIQVVNVYLELRIKVGGARFLVWRVEYRHERKDGGHFNFLVICLVGSLLQIVVLDFVEYRGQQFIGIVSQIY